MKLTICLLAAANCLATALAVADQPTRLTTTGIFAADGRLVRQWSVLSKSPPPVAAWDGRDDRGQPMAPGTYQWRSASIEAGTLRSRWVTAIGAHPARNADGHPLYFPGGIVGATRLESDGEALYIGAPVGDASDILMKTDLAAQKAFWSIDLYQPSLHSVGALRSGGPDNDTLYILQKPDRLHLYSPAGRELAVHRLPPLSHQDQRPDPNDSRLGWNSQLAVNREFIAVSYPNENLVRYFALPSLAAAGEFAAPAAEHLDFLGDRGRDLAFVSAAERRVFLRQGEAPPQAVPFDIDFPSVIRRHGRQLIVATDQGGYLVKADPAAHGRIDETAIPKHGGRLHLLERDGTLVRSFGSGQTNFEGPWRRENLNGVNDFAIAGRQLIALDWPNRLVWFDLDDGALTAERFLSEGSYFTLPIAVPGRPDRLWVRGMFSLYLWEYAIDLDQRTWTPLRVVVNTASSIGATQNNYYRLFETGDRLFVAHGDGQFDLARLDGNRTFPVLRLNTPERPEGAAADQPHFLLNAEAAPGAGRLLPRPPSAPELAGLGLFGLRPDGSELIVLTNIFSPWLFRLPATPSAAGVPVPDWARATRFYDATASFPGLDLYQHFPGVFDAAGNYYGSFGDRNVNVQREKDQHLYWPGVESAHSVIYKISPAGQPLFEVGRVQATRLERHGFVQPVVSGLANQLVFVTDRARPGQQVYTDDGLFIGNTWSDNRPDELPPTLQDPYTRADIMRGAILAPGDGRVFHAQANINRVDLYEILGLDTLERAAGELTLDAPPSAVHAAGKGLAVTFHAGAEFTNPLESRVEPVRHHNQPNMFDHTWLRWPEGVHSAVWKGFIEVPATDAYVLDLHTGGGDDHVRLEVDGQVLLDGPAVPDSRYVKTAPVRLASGRRYPLEIRYRKGAGQPVLRLNWQTPSRNRQTVPTVFLYQTKE